jgi:8-oxo-dGTP diphosphatase
VTILEEGETFLDCVVKEIHEELGYYVPPERFSCVGCRGGRPGSPWRHIPRRIFISREVPLDKVNVTEATLKVAEMGELGELEHALTPSALFALESFFGHLPKSHL